MSKTPYEIRLEVLKMAQDVEMQHFYANRENLMQNWPTGWVAMICVHKKVLQ